MEGQWKVMESQWKVIKGQWKVMEGERALGLVPPAAWRAARQVDACNEDAAQRAGRRQA